MSLVSVLDNVISQVLELNQVYLGKDWKHKGPEGGGT